MNKKVICPLCECDQTALITEKVRFEKLAHVRRCSRCDLVFLDQASFAYPKDFYEREYHQTYITHVEPDALEPRTYFEKMTKATKVWADRFGQMLTGKETVLDVGCSTGHFLEMIKGRANAVYGSELNRREVAFCREELNLDVSSESLEKRFRKGMFDYITLIYVLEHIAQPKAFLGMLKDYLKPDGKIVILVPNVKDALINFYDIPEMRSFYYCIEHLFYYGSKTINILFEQAGLAGSIDTLQEYPVTNHLNWGYRRKPGDTLASRKGIPDIPLLQHEREEEWMGLWSEMDRLYRTFLVNGGFGDRLWCVIGKR